MVRTVYGLLRQQLSVFEWVLGGGLLAVALVAAAGGGQQQIGLVFLILASALVLVLLPERLRRYGRLFGIYVHELCHGIAAGVTGGSFEKFWASCRRGKALTIGGAEATIDAAGYVGTALMGAAALLASTSPAVARVLMAGLAVLLGGLGLLKGAAWKTRTRGLVMGAAVGGVALLPGAQGLTVVVLVFLGVTLLWNTIEGLWELRVYAREHPGYMTDATNLARSAGLRGPRAAVRLLAILSVAVTLAGVAGALVVAG